MSSRSAAPAIMAGVGVLVASLILYQMYKENTEAEEASQAAKKRAADKSRALPSKGKSKSVMSEAATPVVNNTSGREEKALHMKIEELDKKGKTMFKSKNYLQAAEAFTEALDFIASHDSKASSQEQSSSLARQVITLTNNRSAMYEKGGLADLALLDCNTILEKEVGHVKARTRSLRILEALGRYDEALVQVCALQLKFMQDNRTQLRMGVPLQPPVPQQKLEDMIAHLIPAEVEKYMEIAKKKNDRPLPSPYTLTQLLKSFTGYNAWMSKAARSGSVSTLTPLLDAEQEPAKKAGMYLKRGRRHVHDKSYAKAARDFEAGMALVADNQELQDSMEEDEFARLCEWTGMVRHWTYDLEGALVMYEKCSELEPTNVSTVLARSCIIYPVVVRCDSSNLKLYLHSSLIKTAFYPRQTGWCQDGRWRARCSNRTV
jgi:tetratricopeptide (TPR) repeat protein